MTSKAWSRPRLVVMGRGRQEEQVLNACKIPGLGGPGTVPCSQHTSPTCKLNSKS